MVSIEWVTKKYSLNAILIKYAQIALICGRGSTFLMFYIFSLKLQGLYYYI